MAIDMWSFGCILCELYTGFPLLPGEDAFDQMACIIEMFGVPPQYILGGKRVQNFINSKGFPCYCTTVSKNGTILLKGGFSRRGHFRGPPGSKSLKKVLKDCDDCFFLDFIRSCLELDPRLRMTPSEALIHPWLRRRLPRLPNDADASIYLPVFKKNSLISNSNNQEAHFLTSKNNKNNNNENKEAVRLCSQTDDDVAYKLKNRTTMKLSQVC